MLNTIFTDPVTMPQVLLCIAASMVLGVLTAKVFFYHRPHSTGFALTLALMPMMIAVVILLVNGNTGTGIAAAGAFTLVRFRSIEGTAREMSAIFTAVTLGLALGMGYLGIAVLFYLLMAFFTVLLTRFDFGVTPTQDRTLRITIPDDLDHNTVFDEVFRQYTRKVRLTRLQTINMGTMIELSYEITLKEKRVSKEFLDALRARNGNLSIVFSELPDRKLL